MSGDCSARCVWLPCLAFALLAFAFLPGAAAQESDVSMVERVDLDGTTVLEFRNDGGAGVAEFRLWLSGGAIPDSYKAAAGWSAEINSVGVMIFTASNPLESGESAKFGIVADAGGQIINWKANDADGNTILSGATSADDAVVVTPDTPVTPPVTPVQPDPAGVLERSTLRIVPSDPGAGAQVRIVGDDFGRNQQLNLFLGGAQLGGPVSTGPDGSFTVTRTIPAGQAPGSAQISIVDSDSSQIAAGITISNRVRSAPPAGEQLALGSIPSEVRPGSSIAMSGTGEPGIWATVRIADAGVLLTTQVVQVSSSGSWSLTTQVPSSAPSGSHTAVISDGRSTIERFIAVGASQTLSLEPVRSQYTGGNTVIFEGTAEPGDVEVLMRDPLGMTVLQNVMRVNSSGILYIEYPSSTTESVGTYTMIAKQGKNMVASSVGLGESTKNRLIVEFDKVGYVRSETATVFITGIAGSKVTLEFFQGDRRDGDPIVLETAADVPLYYDLDIDMLAQGPYKAVVRSAGAQASYNFIVDPSTGGDISIGGLKDFVNAGQSVLPRIDTAREDVLFTLNLFDPNDNLVMSRALFTDFTRELNEPVRIPSGAEAGEWAIEVVVSGSNSARSTFDVLPEGHRGLLMQLSKPPSGDPPAISLKVSMATPGGKYNVTLYAPNGDYVKSLGSDVDDHFSDAGTGLLIISLEPGYARGTYTINMTDITAGQTASINVAIR